MTIRRVPAAIAVATTAGLATWGAVVLGPSAAASTGLRLHGTIAGTYTTAGGADTGVHYRTNGVGITNLGTVSGVGDIHGPGNIRSGHCTETAVVKTAHGSVTVSVVSQRSVAGSDTCQGSFAIRWRMTKGTGSYAGMTGSGTGTLTVVAPSDSSSATPPAYLTFD